MQVEPAQQPFGQDSGPHEQTPEMQLVPAPHAGFPPQRHSPEVEQLSARAISQVTQAAPPVPQAAAFPVLHVEPEQQPLAQLVAVQSLHAPPEQMRPAQSWQAAPPLPQLRSLVPARQAVPEQHPLAQEVPSQTHAPFTQRCPSAQGAPSAHWQDPLAEHRSAVIPHVAQAAPVEPQLVRESVRQLEPAQHPCPHDMPSQMQLPPTQCCPGAQAVPAPQAQAPASVQASAVMASHTAQAAPPEPHRASDRDTHEAPSQQPLGQEAASQAHRPALHFWPAPQAGPVPQAHPPAAEQPSDLVVSQPTQTAPPWPQVDTEGGLQVAPEQHPVGQVALLQPLHRPAVQVWVLGHVSHAPPPPPQELTLSPPRQTPPEQQPSGQEVPSQPQVLPMHLCPRAQAEPRPHRQVPAAEQLSARMSHATQVEPASPQLSNDRVAQVAPWQHPLGQEVASQMHWPPAQRWPPAHTKPSPHRQTPSRPQRSALFRSQVIHAAPLIPQVVREGTALQTSPEQQPMGQEDTSHTHTPPMQRWPSRHAALPPHRQTPPTEQVSTLSASQPTQASPPMPQVDTERG